MRRSSGLATLSLIALVLVGPPAAALQVGKTDELLSIEIHGFVSQGFMYTTSNNYLAKTTRGSFEFTEIGLNFTKHLTDRLQAGVQLFSRDLGPLGNYSLKADWFYLDYRFRDWLGFRAGRVKLPLGLYNDTSDIDSARAAVLLPQSVYPTSQRNFLLAQTGGEVYGYVPIGPVGALDYRVYGGTIFIDLADQTSSTLAITELSIPYVVGGRLMWETPLPDLRVGGSVQALRLDTTVARASLPMPAHVSIQAFLWVVSAEYAAHNLLLAVEYSRWHTDASSDNEMVYPPTATISERAYGSAAYRVNRWLQPGLYYSSLIPNIDKREAREDWQHDLGAFVRFDINSFWLVKLEGHYMRGTAYLSPGLNDNTPRSMLAEDWALLLLKTTAYF